MNESLHKYIAGENISDYTCSNCNKKVEITKRCVLTSLPNILIIHLQRIVFNLDTLMNEKINSRLEFPLELNMESFMKEEGGTKKEEEGPNKEKEGEERNEEEVGRKEEEGKDKRKDSAISDGGVTVRTNPNPKVNIKIKEKKVYKLYFFYRNIMSIN